MEWQPIETAPKDGTRILGGWPLKDCEIVHWQDGSQAWSLDDGWELDAPTHWMPLPEPPE